MKLSSRSLAACLCMVFLAWFSMKFHMDNSNDSETEAYVSSMLSSVAQPRAPVDATGHYTALAPYVVWPFSTMLERVTGAYHIRGFVLALLFLALVLNVAAYAWYRTLGLGWLTSLFGLVVLSTSSAFALLIRGWELDKLIEPGLFLLAALAAWKRRYVMLLGVAVLAVANRETGVFLILVALGGLAHQHGGIPTALKHWPVWACLVICVTEVALLRRLAPPSPGVVVMADLSLDRLVYVTGGLCLTPLLAAAWVGSAPLALRRLFYLLAPAWLAYVVATDRLEQGAVLLAPLAVLFIPLTLGGLEQAVRAPGRQPDVLT